MKRFFPPFCFLHTSNIQIIILIVMLHNDTASKYKMQFLNDDFIY